MLDIFNRCKSQDIKWKVQEQGKGEKGSKGKQEREKKWRKWND